MRKGKASSTMMTIHDIEQLEVGYHNMRDKNSQLRSECESFKAENQRLVEENALLKKKYCDAVKRCKQLEVSKTEAQSKLDTLRFSQASLREDDAQR